MSTNIPVLPIAGGTLMHAFVALLAFVTRLLKGLARARKHRRDARMLAGFDRHMLADIGITRSDLRDAFATPLWGDPTALLRERAIERRLGRTAVRVHSRPPAENGFHRPATDRPARHTV